MDIDKLKTALETRTKEAEESEKALQEKLFELENRLREMRQHELERKHQLVEKSFNIITVIVTAIGALTLIPSLWNNWDFVTGFFKTDAKWAEVILTAVVTVIAAWGVGNYFRFRFRKDD